MEIEKKKVKYLVDRWMKHKEDAEKFYKSGSILGIPTGFRKIDEETDGFNPQEYWAVGSDSSIGKTALALNFSLNIIKKNYVVFYFITEMGDFRIIERILSIVCNLNTKEIRRKKLKDLPIDLLFQKISELSKYKFYVFAGEVFSGKIIETILNDALPLLIKPNVVFVDYIQQTLEAQTNDWVSGLSMASFKYQEIAKKYNTCVVALSQVSKEGQREHTKTGKVGAYSLKGTSTLKQNADVVLLLERNVENEALKNDLRIKIDKTRSGQTGILNVYFNLETGLITEIEQQEPQRRVTF